MILKSLEILEKSLHCEAYLLTLTGFLLDFNNTLLNPFWKFSLYVYICESLVYKNNCRIVVYMSYCSSNSLIQSLHAKILIVIISSKLGITYSIEILHFFLNFDRLRVWKRKTTDNQSSCEVIRKIYSF